MMPTSQKGKPLSQSSWGSGTAWWPDWARGGGKAEHVPCDLGILELGWVPGCWPPTHIAMTSPADHLLQQGGRAATKPLLKRLTRDFPGSPVFETLSVHCRGHGFDPCSGK